MPPRDKTSANDRQQQTRIAAAAARLIAENGVRDYSLAARKAAERLGVPTGTPLPANVEVDVELRVYQRLYQGDEQDSRIASLRRTAYALMAVVERFRPYLAGSVLDGSAGRFAEIDIQLFSDSSKDVEIFLLNEQIEYVHSLPRSKRAEAVLTIHRDGAVVNLIVYPSHMERVAAKNRDGSPHERANLANVRKLLSSEAP